GCMLDRLTDLLLGDVHSLVDEFLAQLLSYEPSGAFYQALGGGPGQSASHSDGQQVERECCNRLFPLPACFQLSLDVFQHAALMGPCPRVGLFRDIHVVPPMLPALADGALQQADVLSCLGVWWNTEARHESLVLLGIRDRLQRRRLCGSEPQLWGDINGHG